MTKKWILTYRQRFDLEMLFIGGFEPLQSFLTKKDYQSVLQFGRLHDGDPWPIPITLDVNDSFAEKISLNDNIELYDFDNTLLAEMHVTDKWQPDKIVEAIRVFGTEDLKHPGVNYLLNTAGNWYVGGPMRWIRDPHHLDFTDLRLTPSQLKQYFRECGWRKIIGFQTRNPMHRAHFELTLKASEEIGGNLLIHPVIGLTKSDDVDYYTRVLCYQKILSYYPKGKAKLSLLPLAMRMAGPREALLHALIRKNYGCTHFIIGRDHAGPGLNSHGNAFYTPYSAQKFVLDFEKEIGITIVPFEEMVYIKERKQYAVLTEVKSPETALSISGTELRRILTTEKPIPEWFSFPEVILELKKAYLPKHKKGFTLFFTGLSGAGKTALANASLAHLKSLGIHHATILDSDVTRRILAGDLGFSKEDRDLNIRRLGYIASEITKVGGIAIVAAIAPYAHAREINRQLITQYGGYIEIYLSTPFSVCAKRDKKGLYKKALEGELQKFTGLDDPYEAPTHPEINIDTTELSIDESVCQIFDYLIHEDYIKQPEKKSKMVLRTPTDKAVSIGNLNYE